MKNVINELYLYKSYFNQKINLMVGQNFIRVKFGGIPSNARKFIFIVRVSLGLILGPKAELGWTRDTLGYKIKIKKERQTLNSWFGKSSITRCHLVSLKIGLFDLDKCLNAFILIGKVYLPL